MTYSASFFGPDVQFLSLQLVWANRAKDIWKWVGGLKGGWVGGSPPAPEPPPPPGSRSNSLLPTKPPIKEETIKFLLSLKQGRTWMGDPKCTKDFQTGNVLYCGKSLEVSLVEGYCTVCTPCLTSWLALYMHIPYVSWGIGPLQAHTYFCAAVSLRRPN